MPQYLLQIYTPHDRPAPDDPGMDIANWIVFKDARVKGVFGRRLFSTWYQTAEVLKSHMVDLSKVITHKFDMGEFAKAFALMKSGRSGKIIMYPNGKSDRD